MRRLVALLLAVLLMSSFSFVAPAPHVDAGINGQKVRFECKYLSGKVYYAGYNQNGVWTTWNGDPVGNYYVFPDHLWWEGQLNITFTKLPNTWQTTKTYNVPTVHYQDTWFAYC